MKSPLHFLLLAAGLSLSTGSLALPTLQLDIDGGIYVGGDEESTLTSATSFTLKAFGQGVPTGDPLTPFLDNPYYISAAVLLGHDGVAAGTDFGSFSINGTVFSLANGNVVFEIPPSEEFNPDLSEVNDPDLAKHGIFPTIFTEVEFDFVDGQTTPAYNVQDDSSAPGVMNYVDFAVDVSGLLPDFNLHFDLYTYDPNVKKILEFAPFSHDAGTTTRVPEPAVWSLFLIGTLLLVGGFYLRRDPVFNNN